jgi:hypothetical protein
MTNPIDYNVNRQIQGVSGFGRQFPTIIYSATLAGATEEHFTVPSSSVIGGMNSTSTNPRFLAIFAYKPATEFWVSVNATAAVPAGGTFAVDTAELLPSAYEVKAGDTISVISTAGGDISVSIYGMLGA